MHRPSIERPSLLLLGALLLGSCDEARHLVAETGAGRPVLGGMGMTGGGGNDGFGGFAPPLPQRNPPVPPACLRRLGPPPERTVRVDADTLANRLSRLIFHSPSDAALRARVASLRTSAQVKDLAREMRRNALSLAGVEALVDRWLRLPEVRQAVLAPTSPLAPELKDGVLRETRHFGQDVFLHPDGLRRLLTATYTFADGPVAAIYGASPPDPMVGTRLELDPAQRSGVLTHPGILFAHPRPSQRGVWIRQALLCQAIPPPPPNADPDLPMTGGATTRERLVNATQPPACQSCHERIDPPGFALDHFDDRGRWRTTEDGAPVSAMTVIDFLPNNPARMVNGAPELGRALAESCDVQRCTVETFLRHGLGDYDRNLPAEVINELWGDFEASGFDLRELIIDVTGSEAFLTP